MSEFNKIKNFVFNNFNGISYQRTLITTEYELIYDTDQERISLSYEEWNNADARSISFFFSDSDKNQFHFFLTSTRGNTEEKEIEFNNWCDKVLSSGVLNA